MFFIPLKKISGSFIIILALASYVFGFVQNWYHYEKGLEQIQAKNYGQAEKEFNYYLNHPEMHGDMLGVAHFGKGLMFQTMGKYELAIVEFKMAIENDLHPSFRITDSAYINIGNIYFKNKSYKDAIVAYSKAVENNPRNGFAHYYLGLASLRVGEYDRAAKEAETAKKLGVPFTALTDELKKVKDNPSKELDTPPI